MPRDVAPLRIPELTAAPATPAAGSAALYTIDGSTLLLKDDGGAVRVIGPPAITRDSIANATTIAETVLATFTIPANYLAANTALNVRLAGQVSGTATLAYKVHIGTLGTVADARVATFATSAAGVANAHTTADIIFACLTAGAAGTATASGIVTLANAVLGPATAAFAAAAVNTTIANKLTVTVTQSAIQTLTTRVATLERLTAA